METPVNLRRKRLGECQRSVTVDASSVPVPRRARGSTSEFTSISSIFSNDFIRSGSHKYGKLLSRDNTVDSESIKVKLSTHARNDNRRETDGSDPQMSPEQERQLCVEISLQKCEGNRLAPPQRVNLSRRNSPYVVPLLQENNKAAATKRIVRRRVLFNRRRRICNMSVALALVGLMVMMTDMEIMAWNRSNSAAHLEYWVSLFMKLVVVTTTVSLVVSVAAYHAIEVQIYLMESGAEDWRVAMTAKRVMPLVFEILICAICPLPGIDHLRSIYPDPVLRSMASCNGSVVNRESQVPLNVLLSLPMFARSYLACRMMVLHSKQFQDTSIWSIASFNHVSVNFKFVAKTLLSDHPLMVLGVFTLTICCCAAWMFTQCERYNYACERDACHSYLDSLWLVIITLLAIGYGDIVPHTYCGRFVAILTGIAGMGVSAAVISVMTGKIGLTRSEKQVNSFVTDSKLANGTRNAAATVLQETWFIHKHKKNHTVASKLQVIRHQRKFLQAITRFRNVKLAQRNLREKQFEFVDVRKAQHEVQETVLEMQQGQTQLAMHLNILSRSFLEAHNNLKSELQESVADLHQNQEYTLKEMSELQRNIADIQIQLSCIANQLKEMASASPGRTKLGKPPSLSFIGQHVSCMTVDDDNQ